MSEEHIFEWDRPNVGLYEGGRLRIITRRYPNGQFACRLATPSEVQLILQIETMRELTLALRQQGIKVGCTGRNK